MKKYLVLLLTLIPFWNAQAQNIDIDADNRIEWYQDEQKIIAIGNAVAIRENATLKGDTLTALYEKVQLEDGTQKTQIQKIFSDGNVYLKMQDASGSGSHFEYDLPLQKATLTGSPAALENSKFGKVSATKSITYYGAENKTIAIGDVIAQNPEYTVYADKMISYFDEDKQGKKRLNRVEIYADEQPVKIVNNQATVTGRRGTYFPIENKLKIFENVVMEQDGNILKGDYAETDLNTGISRLLATQKQGRVTGVFHNKKK